MYRVMLIDDEQIILQGLKTIVQWGAFDCEVVDTASDGLEGARRIRQIKPDILLTDIMMPGMDGLTMVAGVKSECPRMQVSILTAFRDFDFAQRAINLGVCRYLLKPSRIDEIEEAVRVMTQRLVDTPQSDAGEADASDANSGGFVVKEALKYIEDNYMTGLSLQDVADHVFVSQWHLSKLLNRHTGKSFFDLVNQSRVEHAKALLRDPSLKIRDVAELVGCTDVAHFSKVFKRSEGVSPAGFRDSL